MEEETASKAMVTFEGASSSSSSSAAAPAAPGSEYQVFLSFRGEDTRKNFTDHLYCYLKDAGIRTFRDDEELRVGKEIGPDLLRAIEKSTISIPIISRSYAFSKWCLIELTHMLKCRKNTGLKVYPIFFGVSPSDCKHHQTGCFADAFLQHSSQEFGEDTVQEWKQALIEVTKLKGWEKDKIADGHEGELVKKVAIKICMKLKKNSERITDKLVGMHLHMEAMKPLLDINDCNDVRVIGIHGMGGIGKTTIAKFLFNELGNHFQQQCSFLEDIREKVKKPKNYYVLRNKLIEDILKRKPDGITLNKDTFRYKKVLVVIDDVEERSQLIHIIGSRDWFGSGSRIIVTTRNKDVFVEREGDLVYKPKEMNYDDSLLLLCKHAFNSTQPWEGYEEISRGVVSAAAGLPLTLEVIGSLLFSKKISIWEDTLKKLRSIPPDKVQKRLKISYDVLDHWQKQIFLDIACHFIGQDKTYAFYMWDACGFFPKSGIDVLVSLSLITMRDDVFRMHDQLRDMGRGIVYLENPSDPGERSRLWSGEDAEEVLYTQSGTRKVETFYMASGWDSDCISNEDLKGLSSLRYLHLEGSGLKGNFKGLVFNLRWFRLSFKNSTDGALLGSTNFCAKKLVVLDLSSSDISDGWESLIQIKASTNLKVLNLSGCTDLTKIPECLWNLKSLVELNLSETGITELSEQGIGNLTKLTKLLLKESKMKRLPDAIGMLENLEVMDCSWCSSLEGKVPSGIGGLSCLRVLDLSFTQVDTLPDDVGNMCNLRVLNLHYGQVKKLPVMGIESLQKLEELDCSSCESLEGQLPQGIWSLSSLRVLNLRYTKITGVLPNDISGKLPNLKTLLLSENVWLPAAEELKLPPSITELVIPLTEASLGSLRSLVNLRHLKFFKNGGYCCEPPEEVVVDHHSSSSNSNNPFLPPPFIKMPSSLKDLMLWGFDEHIMSCGHLPAMKFDSSSELADLCIRHYEGAHLPTGSPDLSNCQNLVSLVICDCPSMREIIADVGNRSLGSTWESIRIESCDSLQLLSDLSNMKRLKKLCIDACPELREIKGLEGLTTLKSLIVTNCPLLKEDQLLSDLSNSKSFYSIYH